MRRALPVFLALAWLGGWGVIAPATAQQYDPSDQWQGLPEGEGREQLFYNCVACHSMAIIMQQRLSERVWGDVIDWMEDAMGMPELPSDEREAILNYLTEHFGQDAGR